MKRRGFLGTVLSVPMAGCGWSQEEDQRGPPPGQGRDGGNSGGNGSDENDSDEDGNSDEDSQSSGDGEDENGVEEEELASSEGGEDRIDTPAEELLLPLSALDDRWEETNDQITGTCNTFGRGDPEFSPYLVRLHICAEVHEDEETSIEEYEGVLDRSLKLMDGELDLDPDIGDEATMVRQGARQGEFGQIQLRLLFRDTNATGRIDYMEQTGVVEGREDHITDEAIQTVADLGARMHDRWRE